MQIKCHMIITANSLNSIKWNEKNYININVIELISNKNTKVKTSKILHHYSRPWKLSLAGWWLICKHNSGFVYTQQWATCTSQSFSRRNWICIFLFKLNVLPSPIFGWHKVSYNPWIELYRKLWMQLHVGTTRWQRRRRHVGGLES